MALFSARKFAVARNGATEHRMVIPDGEWIQCKTCGQTLYRDRLEDNLLVCWYCGHHFPMTSFQRVKMLTDEGSFREFDANLSSEDPLQFTDSKSYAARIAENQAKTGMKDAVICGEATLNGHRFALGVMDFRFMGASMGSVVGEKITRMAENAVRNHIPAVIVTSSGGARMQEGILSLMQMAKTCGALGLLKEAALPYIVILTDPTYGGVTASFASIGDCILAEPGAMIGFAGPRVIRETTNSQLPDGFQTAEFLQEKGLVDRVVERKNLRKELGFLLEYFGAPV